MIDPRKERGPLSVPKLMASIGLSKLIERLYYRKCPTRKPSEKGAGPIMGSH
jgi:hypothetical protein